MWKTNYLMVPNEEKEGWHHVAIKTLLELLRGMTSKYHNNFYCLICFHSFATENRLESHDKVCEKKEYYGIVLRTQKNILELNQYMKSNKMLYKIYANIKSLIYKNR